MTRGAVVMIMTILSLSNLSAYGYEFVDGWCNKVHVPDGGSLEKASRDLLNILASETPKYPGLYHCTDAADKGYTQHGEARCGGDGGGDCAACLADARDYMLSDCTDRLGGQAREPSGVCYIRFENYHFCLPN